MIETLTCFYRFLGGVMALALVLVLVVNIIAREVFSVSLAWANEAGIAFFVWMTFVGAGLCFAQNARIRFTMIADGLPSAPRHVLNLLVTYVGAVLFAGFLVTSIYATWLYRGQVFATMPFSLAWQWAAVPVGLLLCLIGWVKHGIWWSPKDGDDAPADAGISL